MRIIAQNKKARHNYQILQSWEAGLVLSGPEVKSTKKGQINLSGSYVSVQPPSQVWLTNAQISPYPPAIQIQEKYDPKRKRKLLLNKKEILQLIDKSHSHGATIIPLKVYLKNNLIKLEICLARGKKKRDQREDIKEKEWERKQAQLLKTKA